jgi:glycosyltransferase involved in cell wall biosynthesis
MKIALIGPGIMPIPPPGWGAVEILIWDYYNELKKLGHSVMIINTKDIGKIIDIVNTYNFDFVHLHYDVYYIILFHLRCPRIAITSHYPYIDRIEKHREDGYDRMFNYLIKQSKFYNFVLADKDKDTFLRYGANPNYIKKIKNGINSSLFSFEETPKFDKTIYLGKITPRKNQSRYQNMDTIDFVGNCDDSSFNMIRSNYLGEWTRERIHGELTNYVNLLLISEGEADPLVVKEALIAGLGVVINKSSSENLDTNQDFITVIEDEKAKDLEYVKEKLEENKKISITKRSEIRKYGISKFDISIEVESYLKVIESLEVEA